MNPAPPITVSPSMSTTDLTPAMAAHLDHIIAKGGTVKVLSNARCQGPLNRGCLAAMRRKGLVKTTPGREGVPPVVTVTAAGYAARQARAA